MARRGRDAGLGGRDVWDPNGTERRLARRSRRIWPVAAIIVTSCVVSPLAMAVSASSAGYITRAGSQLERLERDAGSERPGRAAATQAVVSYLDGDNTPFPRGVEDIQWSSAQRLRTDPATGTSGDQSVPTEWWSHRFTFTDKASGTTRIIAQLVAVRAGTPTVSGTPSLVDAPLEGDADDGTTPPSGYRTLDRSDTLEANLTAWAKAWCGTDATQLGVLVADPDTSHAYRPASLGVFKALSVDWLVRRDIGGKAYGVAGVRVQFTPPGRFPDKERQDVTPSSSTSAVVLVADPSSGSSRVVAWGAAGDVDALEPYGNAVDRSVLDEASSRDGSQGSQQDSASQDGSQGSASQDATDGKE